MRADRGRCASRVLWGLTAASLLAVAAPARALDHDNLDTGRPLRLEDAYPIAKGEAGLESGLAVRDRRGDGSGYGFEVRAVYGLLYNTQVEIGGDVVFEGSSAAPTDRSGAATAGVLYNLNTETLALPALAVRGDVAAPSGVGSTGVDVSVGAIMTRTVGRLRTHINLGYTNAGSAAAGERGGRYQAAVGAGYPLGYPVRFRETLIVDAFTHQSAASGAPNTTGLEVGIRHQLSPRIVLDVGVGTETAGPADRSAAYGTVGLAVGF